MIKTVNDHVALAERMTQLYGNKTTIFVSSLLPRYDWEEHSIWVQQYNFCLAQAVGSSWGLRLIHWDDIGESNISVSDGLHLSRSGNRMIHQSLTEKLCWQLSAQHSTMHKDQIKMERNYLSKQRSAYHKREAYHHQLKNRASSQHKKKPNLPITRFTGPGKDRGLHPRSRGPIHHLDPNLFQIFDLGDVAVAVQRTAVHCMQVIIIFSLSRQKLEIQLYFVL